MVECFQHQDQILAGSNGITVSGNAEIGYDGGSDQEARIKENPVKWDDWGE